MKITGASSKASIPLGVGHQRLDLLDPAQYCTKSPQLRAMLPASLGLA
jgi:hypothetical protein